MQYVIETATGEMVFAIEDGAAVILSADGLIAEAFRASDIRPGTHEIISPPVPCPSTWGREYRWTGTAWVAGSARRGRIAERLAAIPKATPVPIRTRMC